LNSSATLVLPRLRPHRPLRLTRSIQTPALKLQPLLLLFRHPPAAAAIRTAATAAAAVRTAAVMVAAGEARPLQATPAQRAQPERLRSSDEVI